MLPFIVEPKKQVKVKSQYEPLMKKFTDSHKEQCKFVDPKNVKVPPQERDEVEFCTGSSYEGEWNVIGMHGFGIYKFETGAEFVGRISDGEIHGRGEITFPSGDSVRGRWDHGAFVKGEYFFFDGLQYESEDWAYCRMPDRRFFIEIESGIKPVNISYKTADQPTLEIPDGYYDTGAGFYDPVTKEIYKYDMLSDIFRSPDDDEMEWIVNNCRKAPDGPIGPCQRLYEIYYKSTKYLDEDSTSESEHSWLTAGDPEFDRLWSLMCTRVNEPGIPFRRSSTWSDLGYGSAQDDNTAPSKEPRRNGMIRHETAPPLSLKGP